MKIPRTTQIKDNRKSFGEYTIVRTWSAVKKHRIFSIHPATLAETPFTETQNKKKLKSYIVNVVEKKLTLWVFPQTQLFKILKYELCVEHRIVGGYGLCLACKLCPNR